MFQETPGNQLVKFLRWEPIFPEHNNRIKDPSRHKGKLDEVQTLNLTKSLAKLTKIKVVIYIAYKNGTKWQTTGICSIAVYTR